MSNWYSKKQKVLFIHIPKTGGFSIRQTMLKDATMSFKVDPSLDYDFSFAFVRNPFGRFLSTYYMFKLGGITCRPPVIPDLTIDKLLDTVENSSIPHTNNKNKPYVFAKHHALPMTHPYNCIQYAEEIYRYENYNQAYIEIAKILGKPTNVPHLNKSKNFSKDYREVLNTEQRKRIEEIYKEDLERFNYEW